MPNTPRTDIGPPGAEHGPSRDRLDIGANVCVWNHFLERWSPGFSVAEVVPLGYRLRRLSDGHIFDDVFASHLVIRERRRRQDPGIVGTYRDRRRPDEEDVSSYDD